ncbi:hypothetical protein BTN50_0639 [Candidatus Enterovibrio altilux]|uniref:Uncharacterized protein n=1 Tax=Candidatus Enterovibrio altilux TaxID=1927128 RepID=A0A291B832_9GAMM|nr:hypothetical protein BTN50_0639 [Candidatus Enterovibrio luxaltus]
MTTAVEEVKKTERINPYRLLNGIESTHLTMKIIVMVKSLNKRGLLCLSFFV